MMHLSVPLIRRKSVLVAVIGIVILAVVWWFAWMSPEGKKLTTIRQQQVIERQTEVDLNLRLVALKDEAKQVQAAAPFLKSFAAAIPGSPDAPNLVVAVYDLAVADGVSLQSISDNSVESSTSGYSTIPVELSLTGPHDALLHFVQGLYGLSRLLTLQSISMSGNGNLNSSNGNTYTASISATAYTTYASKPTSGT